MPLAVDVGGTKISCGLVNGAAVTERQVVPTPQPATPAAVVEAILGLVQRPFHSAEAAIGVAMTGRVVDGLVTAANQATLPGWIDFPLREALEQRLSRKVTVVNDAQAAAWGEYRFGAGERTSDGFAFVTISTGIGAGLVVGGRLLTGSRGWAGHIGFTRTGERYIGEAHPGGAYPSETYLEDIASGRALGRLMRSSDGNFLSAAEVIELSASDTTARALVQGAARAVRIAIGNLAIQLDARRAAIGGSVGLNQLFFEELIAQECHPLVEVEVVEAALGPDAGLVGVADLVAGTDSGILVHRR